MLQNKKYITILQHISWWLTFWPKMCQEQNKPFCMKMSNIKSTKDMDDKAKDKKSSFIFK
jgi:hypothetical protein